MGVIPINFSPEVEVFIKGIRAGTRSAAVDNVMKKHLRARLGDDDRISTTDTSIQQLTAICINKHQSIEEFNQEWLDRAMLLRDIFIKHLEGEQ